MNGRRVLPRPISEDMSVLGFRRRPPVRNVSPLVILRTVAQIVASALTGLERERRDIAVAPLHPYAHPEIRLGDLDEIWVDFVADSGDGFASTYTVARLLAEPTLAVGEHATRRGSLLVMGGDLVYPWPDRAAYRDRLVGPYRAAFPVEDPLTAPDVLVLPGDHDWMDGLAAFRATFVQGGWLGGWRLRQTRSYFVASLPHRWWLWAPDTLLGVDLEPQRQYFRDAAARLRLGDRVILCTHHPLWRGDSEEDAHQLRVIQELIAGSGAEIAVTLSGHSHYYAHYAPSEGLPHAIVAGGGGACTEDTSGLPRHVEMPVGARTLTLEGGITFPSAAQSLALAATVVVRLPKLGAAVGLATGVYWAFLLSWGSIASAIAREQDVLGWLLVFLTSLRQVLVIGPVGLGLFLLILLGLQGSPGRRWLGAALGVLHGAMHAVCAVLVCGLVVRATGALQGNWLQIANWFGIALGTSITTVVVIAVYLALARLVGLHKGELVPALSIQDYKSFVRLHVATDGTLTVLPVGVTDVPRRWKLRTRGPEEAPWFVPDAESDESVLDLAKLIHAPIVVPPSEAQRAAVASPGTEVQDEPPDVFICYSSVDGEWVRAFLDVLQAAAAERGIADLRVFIDTASLRINEYWRPDILEAIERCHAFLTILSPGFVDRYKAKRMCLTEYVAATARKERGEADLIYHVFCRAVDPPAAMGGIHGCRLEGVPRESIGEHPQFLAFTELVFARIERKRSEAAAQSSGPRQPGS